MLPSMKKTDNLWGHMWVIKLNIIHLHIHDMTAFAGNFSANFFSRVHIFFFPATVCCNNVTSSIDCYVILSMSRRTLFAWRNCFIQFRSASYTETVQSNISLRVSQEMTISWLLLFSLIWMMVLVTVLTNLSVIINHIVIPVCTLAVGIQSRWCFF